MQQGGLKPTPVTPSSVQVINADSSAPGLESLAFATTILTQANPPPPPRTQGAVPAVGERPHGHKKPGCRFSYSRTSKGQQWALGGTGLWGRLLRQSQAGF